MPFTDSEKDRIRRYLSMPAGYYFLSSRLESMMDKIGDQIAEKNSVLELLQKIEAVDCALGGSAGIGASSGSDAGGCSGPQGPIKKIGNVEFYNLTSENMQATVPTPKYGRILINRLALRFGFQRDELPGDYFGAGGGGGEIAYG